MGRKRKEQPAEPDLSHILPELRPLAVPIESLVPDDKNPRHHGKHDVAVLRESLARFGQRSAIVVRKGSNVIQAGHGRRIAALELGWTHIAAVHSEDDDTTSRHYQLADNKTAELSEWDWPRVSDMISDMLDADSERDDFTLLGWSDDDLDAILGGGMGTEKKEPPEKQKPPPTFAPGEIAGKWVFGDCIEKLRKMEPESVHCCVTSPPYWGLRDYGHDGQIGLEETPDEYVERMVEVFSEVRRVLRDDGTLWLNLGDSFRDKQLQGVPWRVALALQATGWFLRSDIIWHKPNPMPEPVEDRPTKGHEYLFLLSKAEGYYYDADSIREPHVSDGRGGFSDRKSSKYADCAGTNYGAGPDAKVNPLGRNKRSVWTVATRPYAEAHFAVFPPALIEPCILAGCPVRGVVLDPFFGSGTTGQVAQSLGRHWYGIELNEDNDPLIRRRLKDASGGKA